MGGFWVIWKGSLGNSRSLSKLMTQLFHFQTLYCVSFHFQSDGFSLSSLLRTLQLLFNTMTANMFFPNEREQRKNQKKQKREGITKDPPKRDGKKSEGNSDDLRGEDIEDQLPNTEELTDYGQLSAEKPEVKNEGGQEQRLASVPLCTKGSAHEWMCDSQHGTDMQFQVVL